MERGLVTRVALHVLIRSIGVLLGMILGFFVFAFVASHLATPDQCPSPCEGPAFVALGAAIFIGSPLGAAAGYHVARAFSRRLT